MCLSNKEIVKYLSGNRNPETEKHLIDCADCRNLIFAEYVRNNLRQRAYKTLIDKTVEKIIGSQESIADIVIRWTKQKLQAISDLWHYAEPVLVRGDTDENTLVLTRKINNLSAKIIIEKVNDQLCDITVALKGRRNKSVENIRVVLSENGVDKESYYLKNGQALFSNVGIGKYHFLIWKEAAMIAKISMDFK